MFNLFKKNKNPEIIFWSVIDGVEKLTPILPSSNFIPDWFKSIKSPNLSSINYDEKILKNIKNCPGIFDYFKKGFVMTMWCDLKINITPEGYQAKTPNDIFKISFHSHSQYIEHIPEQAKKYSKCVIKPLTPWRCKTQKGYSLLELPLLYHYNENFTTMAGVTDTDIFHELNPQLIFKKYGEFFIPKGTPLSHMIPFKREEFDLKIIKNGKKTKYWDNVSKIVTSNKFFGAYRDEQKKSNECPFHKKNKK